MWWHIACKRPAEKRRVAFRAGTAGRHAGGNLTMLRGIERDVCAHCQVPIVDPTVQVVHGAATYCCANCSAAMEGAGAGSDPKATHRGDTAFRCAHCGVTI